jgi:predicted nuclease with TOPRIM domain
VKEKQATSPTTKTAKPTLKESTLSKLQGELRQVKKRLEEMGEEFLSSEESTILALSKLQEELANLTCRYETRFGAPPRVCQVCGTRQILAIESPHCSNCGARDSVGPGT